MYIGEESNSGLWDDRWEHEDLTKIFFPRSYSIEDRFVLDITREYLPIGARILEGGCGLGEKVFFLKRLGYEVIGVDYATKTVDKLNKFMPELDIRYGNLEKLDFPDCFFDGYWSFGVIEHYYNGYDRIAREMFRTLKPDGYLFMTVPAMSCIRKMKAFMGFYPGFDHNKIDATCFYQFAYSSEEIQQTFCEHGFRFVEKQGWAVYAGVRDEIPCSHFAISFLCRFFDNLAWRLLINYCNHMDLFVFRK